MTTEATVNGIGVTDVEVSAAQSAPWLADRRRSAWDAFTALPWPSMMRDEDWRRTDIAKLLPTAFRIDAQPSTELDAVIDAARADIAAVALDAVVVVCDRSGRVQIDNADALLAQGVVISSLDEATVRHPELVQRALGIVPAGEQPLTSLWNALWRGGVFIYVPKAVDAAVPVWVIHAGEGEQTATFPATVCVLDANASLSLVELHTSPAGATPLFSDAVSAAHVARDARLDHCILQRLGVGAWHMATHRAHLDANAHLRFFGATLGARLQKGYWDAILDGDGSEASLGGIVLGSGTQHLDHQSLQAHRGRNTSSRLSLKVAVRDTARSVYSGLIDVEPAAQGTDAYVKNQNLILSHGAKADAVPRLEIRANDVKCGHGATAGHIDDNQRFYLTARGVAPDDADRIIIRGFLDDALLTAPLPAFAALVSRDLDTALGQTSGALDAS